jgi:hypothetical protein
LGYINAVKNSFRKQGYVAPEDNHTISIGDNIRESLALLVQGSKKNELGHCHVCGCKEKSIVSEILRRIKIGYYIDTCSQNTVRLLG